MVSLLSKAAVLCSPLSQLELLVWSGSSCALCKAIPPPHLHCFWEGKGFYGLCLWQGFERLHCLLKLHLPCVLYLKALCSSPVCPVKAV